VKPRSGDEPKAAAKPRAMASPKQKNHFGDLPKMRPCSAGASRHVFDDLQRVPLTLSSGRRERAKDGYEGSQSAEADD